MANVRIGGAIFQGGEGLDGFFLEPNSLDAWFSGVDIRREEVPLPQAHGSFDLPVFNSSRLVPVVGHCITDSAERLHWYEGQLTGLLASGNSTRVFIDMPWGVTWADGHLGGKPEFDVQVWGSFAKFQLPIWFPNPRKFGDTRTFASGTAAFHYGNFAADPVHTITGANAAGYTINGPSGKKFIVTQPLASGHPHVVDMSTGFLSVDGVVINGGVTQADLWPIGPGQQVVHTITGAGAILSTAVTDTYI